MSKLVGALLIIAATSTGIMAGDHIIFIGHAEGYADPHKPTLSFCRGKYMRGQPLIPA